MVIVITTFIVSVITENLVINRLQTDKHVDIISGKCRLKQEYAIKLYPELASRSLNDDIVLEHELEVLKAQVEELKSSNNSYNNSTMNR